MVKTTMTKLNKSKRTSKRTSKTQMMNKIFKKVGIKAPTSEDVTKIEATLKKDSSTKNTISKVTLTEVSLASALDLATDLNLLDPVDYFIEPVREKLSIEAYVEKFTRQPYALGSVYYELTKEETIHSYTYIYIQDMESGAVFRSKQFKKLLGIDNGTYKVSIASNNTYRVFVQSNSRNRNLVPGTFILVR